MSDEGDIGDQEVGEVIDQSREGTTDNMGRSKVDMDRVKKKRWWDRLVNFGKVQGTPLEGFEDAIDNVELDYNQEFYSRMCTVRSEGGYTQDGIFSNERLKVAAKGIDEFRNIFQDASPNLRKWLSDPRRMQVFTGVRPIHSLDTRGIAIDEFSGLLQKYSTGIFMMRVPSNYDKSGIEIVNIPAVNNVIHENTDIFDQDDINNFPNVGRWLISRYNGIMKKELVQFGLLSGFPVDSCRKYIDNNYDGQDLVDDPMYEPGLEFVVYSRGDLEWLNQAGHLLSEFKSDLQI